ncbi:MAG: phosphate ABC transporter permease subunit PstC [Acidobacteria bacterium]|nr:MAG: phosphate ABC transporter permease subunit PstC [Acidobacteriota bacterium]
MPSSTTIAADAGAPRRVRKLARRLQRGDQIAHVITFLFAATIFIITALLFYELYTGALLTRQKFGWNFLSGTTWDPVALEFGALPFIYGTLVTSALALIIGVPLGVGAAIFLAELAPIRISNGLAFIIELLAAVPSVIYGLLAIFTLVPFLRDYVAPVVQSTLGFLPFFQGQSYGVSLLAGGSILAIMVLPFIISISREVLLAVPREQREASLALGATQWETTWNVVVPYAKAGIVGSIFLALARALGETMAVTMVIGNDPKINLSLFAPGYSIAAAIANEFTEATGDMHISALIELGFVLFCITIAVNAVARLLILTTTRKSGVT